MLQAYQDDLLIVGITRGNVDKLLAHKPMRIQLARNVKEILVVFGEDKPSIIRELESAGAQFENAHKAAAESDPS